LPELRGGRHELDRDFRSQVGRRTQACHAARLEGGLRTIGCQKKFLADLDVRGQNQQSAVCADLQGDRFLEKRLRVTAMS